MTPQAFIAKWRDNPLTERAGAQAHFEDLCALLEVEPPRVEGEYQYERGLIKKSSASQGWADVWKRNCFAWEYKAPDKDLGAALKQLMMYALALDLHAGNAGRGNPQTAAGAESTTRGNRAPAGNRAEDHERAPRCFA
jgi:hypothetical protein